MFVFVTDMLPDNANIEQLLPRTIEAFKKDKILYMEIPINNGFESGKAVVRLIPDEQVNTILNLEDENIRKEYMIDSLRILKYLEEQSSESQSN